MPEVSSLPANPDTSQYSPYGRDYGNGILNLLAFSSFGFNYAPKPQGAQGMYDAYYQRERSRQFMGIQQDAFANNMLFKSAGFDPENNMLQFAGKAFGSPDGMVSRMLSPLIGGNPVAAQMQLYAGLSGASVMGAFGRIGDVSKKETDDMMRVVEKNFYRTTPIDQVEKDMDKKFTRELVKNPQYAEQLGVGVPRKEDGTIDTKKQKEFQRKGNKREKQAEKLRSVAKDFEINEKQIQRPYDPKITANVTPKLEKALERAGVSPDTVRGMKDGGTGEIDLKSAREELNKAAAPLRSETDYKLELADQMADQMGIPFKKNFVSRELTLEGGVPTQIDGQTVPAELHTQEQRDSVNMARQAGAANEGAPPPPIYGEGVAPAASDTYKDIVKPEEDEQKRSALQRQVNEGFRLTEVLDQNEKNRKNTPYSARETARLSDELDRTLLDSGMADQQALDQNRVGSIEGRETGGLSSEFVGELKEKNNLAVQQMGTLSEKLQKSEKRSNSPVYSLQDSQEVSAQIAEGLKRDFNVDANEIAEATTTAGVLNPEFVKGKIDKRERELEKVSTLESRFNAMNNSRSVSADEIEAVSSRVEARIQGTGALTEEQIAGGKTESGRVSSSLVDTLERVAGSAITDVNSLTGDLGDNELKAATAQYDQELSKAISDKIKKKLEDSFGATEEELARATNSKGVVDPQFVKDKVAEQENKLKGVRQDFESLEKMQELKNAPAVSTPEQVEENDKRQQEIRKILKDKYKITDEQLSEATDDKGNIKKEFIEEVYSKEMDRAGVEKAGLNMDEIENFKLSKEAPKLRAQYFDRQMQAEEIGKIQDEIKTARNLDTDEGRERAQKLNEDLKIKLKGLGISDDKLDDNATDKEGGLLGFGQTKYLSDDFVKTQQQELTKKTYADVEAQRMTQYQQAGFKYSGINFEKTRGFNVEDFTSAFTAASDLRLIGGKGTPVEKMEGFMENSGGAMSAARSVFGDNLSGGQLVGKVSDLLGSKAQDLTSQDGAQEVEKMLRDVKATARVAGVSIDALLGVIDAAKDVARNNPRLRQMSSAAITDMSLKALSTTAGMAGAMNASEYRASGGTQQMLGEKIGEQQKLLSSDVGQSMIALQQKFAADPKKMEAFKRAMKKGGFDERGVTERDIPAVVKALMEEPEMAGVSKGELYFAMNDSSLREFGTKNADIMNYTEGVMGKGANSKFYRHIEKRLGQSKEDFIKGYEENRKTNENLTFEQYVSDKLGGKDPVALNLYKELKHTIEEDVYRTTDPEYFKKIEESRNRQRELDTELDKKLGGRNAPVITQIVDELSRGDKLDGAKTEKLMRLFADENVYSDKGEMERLQTGFTQAVEAAAIQDTEGVAEGLSEALDIDISEKDLKAVEAGGKVTGNYKEAQNEYRRLKEGGAKTKEEKTRLRGYEAMEKLGLLDTDSDSTAKQKAFEVFQQGEGVAGITAAAIEAEKNKKNQEQITEVKKGVADALGEELAAKAKRAGGGENERRETQKLLDYYEDNGGTEQMMKDAAEGAGAFDENSDIGKAFNQEDGGTIKQVKDRINQANEQISETEKKLQGEGGEASSEDDLGKQLKALIKALDDSKLTNAIQNLASNISG